MSRSSKDTCLDFICIFCAVNYIFFNLLVNNSLPYEVWFWSEPGCCHQFINKISIWNTSLNSEQLAVSMTLLLKAYFTIDICSIISLNCFAVP